MCGGTFLTEDGVLKRDYSHYIGAGIFIAVVLTLLGLAAYVIYQPAKTEVQPTAVTTGLDNSKTLEEVVIEFPTPNN